MKITKTVLLIVLFLVLVFLMTGPTIVHACTDNGEPYCAAKISGLWCLCGTCGP